MNTCEEMPSGCVYRNCRNSYDKHRGQYTFHRFPPKTNEELHKKWLYNCGLEEDYDTSRSRICSAHFKPDDYERDLKSELLGIPAKKRLKDNAEPIVNITLIKQEPASYVHEWEGEEINPELRPHYILEQLAEVAVNRALDDGHFNNRSVERFHNEVPVELVESNSQDVVSTVSHVPSSLPASQNWPGEYNFDVTFSPQDKNTKGVSWTYSRTMDKLYVGKDAPCPINFSTNTIMPEDVRIRAMALYSSPESASEIVVRCINHALEDKAKNIFEAEHLVRCESSSATYEVDSTTKRHSVVVPFENPPIGQHYSTYIYKFTCFGSCPFGPNRRPLMLVFTLERGNTVIGRRKVDVKICACPGRDRKTDEKQCLAMENGTTRKRKEPEFMSLSDTLEFTKEVTFPAPKKAKIAPNPEGMYRLYVEDPQCYEFLKQMKTFYEICKTMKNMPAEAKKILFQYHQRKFHNQNSDA